MTRTILTVVFASILIAMLAVTTYASLDRGILQVGSDLLGDRWFQATLADAYFGFLTFYAWVYYKERHTVLRVIWFVLIMTLGNIAMSIYVLIQLSKWDAASGVDGILLRRAVETSR